MRILKGKKIVFETDLLRFFKDYNSVTVDIGTGNGKFIYKLAQKHPDDFFIGLDPAADKMAEYSSKAIKKSSKGGLLNVLYVVSSIEDIPPEMSDIANHIYINLPWGSLLEGLVKGDDSVLKNIASIASPMDTVTLEILFTYSFLYESGEIEKRDLPELSSDYIKNILLPKYAAKGIQIEEINIVDNDALQQMGTQWSKKLGFGRHRDVFQIKCKIR